MRGEVRHRLMLRGPAALAPLRHPVFRALCLANLASNTGLFIQNTAAGWLMTSLDGRPIMVSLVQASSMLMLMTLGAGQGDEVTLRAEGEGAEESVNALADLLEKDLDAEE